MSELSDAITLLPTATVTERDGAALRDGSPEELIQAAPERKVLAHDKEVAREFLAALDPTATEFTLFSSDERVTVCFPAGYGGAV
jgi:hypothetical protein